MPNTIEIRAATAADVDRIVRLSNAGGPNGKPRSDLPATLPVGYADAFRRINADPKQMLMVAESGGNVIGTFHLIFLTPLAAAGKEDCQVEAVHVDAAWRNQGIGTQLMRWAIAEAKRRGCRRLQLTSNKQRKSAHRFYKRLGFVLSHEGAKLDLRS